MPEDVYEMKPKLLKNSIEKKAEKIVLTTLTPTPQPEPEDVYNFDDKK